MVVYSFFDGLQTSRAINDPLGKLIAPLWITFMAELDHILQQALSLRPSAKTQLIERLISSLDKSDKEIDQMWAEEVEERIEAYERGEIKAVPLEEVLNKYPNRGK